MGAQHTSLAVPNPGLPPVRDTLEAGLARFLRYPPRRRCVDYVHRWRIALADHRDHPAGLGLLDRISFAPLASVDRPR